MFEWSLTSKWQYLAGAAVFFGLLLILYASLIERFWIEERNVRVVLDRLPRSFSGLRIALLSDIHLGVFYGPRHLSRVVDLVNQRQPDIICLVGDLASGKLARGYQEVVPELYRMRAAMKKLAVLGNNDHKIGLDRVRAVLESGGFQVLVNDCITVGGGNERLFFVGLNDALEGEPDPETVMQKVPEGLCCILLVHEPDYADYIQSRFDIDLQLSGHSHGGQFCLPWIGPLITSRMGKRYKSGLYKIKKMQLYTTRGVGTTLLPFRLLCRPEITLLKLETLK